MLFQVEISNINMKPHRLNDKVPCAACPQLFHREEPQVDQSSCHRNSTLLQRAKEKSKSMKSSERGSKHKSKITHISWHKGQQHTAIGIKEEYKNTRSGEGGIEAVEVLPLPFRTIMFDYLFYAEVIGSMCCSGQTRNKTVIALNQWKQWEPVQREKSRLPQDSSIFSQLHKVSILQIHH